jgi:hypothetical protein
MMSLSKQRIAALTVIAALFLIVGSSLKTRPVARVNGLRAVVFADERMACDQRTVLGTYGFQGQGTLGLGTPQSILAAETGVATADGVGNLEGNVTFSLGGQILSTPFAGTYQVNANCTISETITFGTQTRHQQGVIVDRGRQIDFIDTDPGTVLTRVAKRVDSDE